MLVYTHNICIVGDIAEVFYCNPVDLVNRAISRLVTNSPLNPASLQQYTADSCLSVARNTDHYGVRTSRVNQLSCISVFDLFHKVLDISAVPKRSFFLSMAEYADNAEERTKLLELGSALGTDLYFDYCIKERRSYVEVLEEFRSVSPPLSVVFNAIPLIQPRQYSIASAEKALPVGQLDLCVAVAKYTTPLRRHRYLLVFLIV